MESEMQAGGVKHPPPKPGGTGDEQQRDAPFSFGSRIETRSSVVMSFRSSGCKRERGIVTLAEDPKSLPLGQSSQGDAVIPGSCQSELRVPGTSQAGASTNPAGP